jgi:hypothetical protein
MPADDPPKPAKAPEPSPFFETAATADPSAPGQKTLYFVKPFRKWIPGDSAGFPAKYANQIMAGGYAREAGTVPMTPPMVRK